jgi:hypothetical protein
MAHDSSLVAFLDGAEEVSMLASKLGFAFQQEAERQRESSCIDPTSWDRHRPVFDQYCQALSDLAPDIQNPPHGSGAVGDELKRAAKIAREIRDGMKVDDYRCFAEYVACYPVLNSVAWDLHSAIKHVRKTLDSVDPFGFLDGASAEVVACQDEPPFGARDRVLRELTQYQPHVVDMYARPEDLVVGPSHSLYKAMAAFPGPLTPKAAIAWKNIQKWSKEIVDRCKTEQGKSERRDGILKAIAELQAELCPERAANGGNLIERLLAGPDDAELTETELALLEAHLILQR